MPRKVAEIPIDLLQLPKGYRIGRQPPVRAAELEEVRACGVLRPVCARPLARDREGVRRYEIIAQVRSWILAQRSGLETVPTYVCDDLDEEALSHIDHGQEDVLPGLAETECASARVQHGKSVAAVAAELGIGRTVLSHRLRVLTLPDGIRRLIDEGKLTFGHARALVTLSADQAWRLARAAVAQGWSVRRMEREARAARAGGNGTVAALPQPGRPKSAPSDESQTEIRRLEEWLSERMHTRVRIHSADIRIDTGGNLDVIDGILEALGYQP